MGFRLRNATYREAAEVNETLAGRDLKLIAEAGLIQPVGERRGRHYVAAPPLRLLEETIRQPRKPIEDPFVVTAPTLGL